MSESSGGSNFASTNPINVITTTSITTFSQPMMITTTPVCSPSQFLNVPDLSTLSPLMSPLQSASPELINSPSTVNSDNIHDDNAACPWQVIRRKETPKRQRESDKNNPSQTAKKSNINNIYGSIPTSNRYAELQDESTSQRNIEEQQEIDDINYKPPPIYIQDVENYPNMLACIETSLGKEEFYCKTFANNNVKVNTKTPDAYRKLVHLLKQNKVAHHTFQPRQERAYRVVIKNLHHSIPTEEIKEALVSKGFIIRNVANLRSWKTKQPLPLYFVDQEPNNNNKNIYNLTHLLGTKINVEAPRKRKEIPQCMRCQQYGHTKSYCTKPYNCVKCAENHPTNMCQKNRNTPAKCVHCDLAHPANYKGCSVYRDLLKSRNNPTYQSKNYNIQKTPTMQENPATQNANHNLSYAQVTKTSSAPVTQNENISLQVFLNKFETMFNQLMHQNSIIINLLSTLVKNTK